MEDAFRAYLLKLDEKKAVVMCGDLNVAHKEIDLKNPKTNRHNAGFTDEERGKFTELLEAGFTDSFRYFIRRRQEFIPGGLIGLRLEKKMRGGGLITSVCLRDWRRNWFLRGFIRRCLGRIIVRWKWL